MRIVHYIGVLFCVLCAVGMTATHAAQSEHVAVELNSLEQVNENCRLTFVVQNKLAYEVTDLSLEVVLFDKSAKVMKFVKLSAGTLPKDKTKVKRFSISKSNCADIARVLVNDVASCKAGSLTAKQCLDALNLANKSNIDFGL